MQLDGQEEGTHGGDQPALDGVSAGTGAEKAYVTDCEYDIFLSYAQDNNVNPSGGPGWIDQFFLALQKAVNDKLTEDGKVRIFLDKGGLAPNGSLDEGVRKAVRNSALLVIVFSPRYLNRPWCTLERKEFIDAAVGIDRARCRLFVIAYEDVAANRIPEELQDSLRIEFFERSLLRRFTSPLQSDLPSHREKYTEQLYFTAERVADALNRMRKKELPEDAQWAVKPVGLSLRDRRLGFPWRWILVGVLVAVLIVIGRNVFTPETKLQVIVSKQLVTQIPSEEEQNADSTNHWRLELNGPRGKPFVVDPYFGQPVPLERKSISVARGDQIRIRLRSPSKECIEWSWEIPAGSQDFTLDEKPFVSCP